MDIQTRKSPRLKNYDYGTSGAYFITICTHLRRCIFGSVVGEGSPLPKLSAYGEVVNNLIEQIPEKYENVTIDKYVIMPNHIHLLLSFTKQDGRGNPSPTINEVVGWFKYHSTKKINSIRQSVGEKVFQRSFYDHIVRNQTDYKEIWKYIDNNPLKWCEDCFYKE